MHGIRGASGRFQSAKSAQSREGMQGVSEQKAEGAVQNAPLSSLASDHRPAEGKSGRDSAKENNKDNKDFIKNEFVGGTNPHVGSRIGVVSDRKLDDLGEASEEEQSSGSESGSESSQADFRRDGESSQATRRGQETSAEARNTSSQSRLSYAQAAKTPPRSKDSNTPRTQRMTVLTSESKKQGRVQQGAEFAYEDVYKSQEAMEGAREATRQAAIDLVANPMDMRNYHQKPAFLTEYEQTSQTMEEESEEETDPVA